MTVPSLLTNACNSEAWKAEAGRSGVQGQDLKGSQG